MNTEGYRAGVEGALLAAAHGYKFIEGSLDAPSPGETEDGREYRLAYRTGYLAESARIANRRMSAPQRDLLIAHDRAVAAYKKAPGHLAYMDDDFIRADLALFGLNPWLTLGIKLGQYQGPAAQARDRIYDPTLLARAAGGKS